VKKNKLTKIILAGTLAVTTVLAGCGTTSTSKADYPKKAMEFIAPSGAGGGWDLTIRTVAKVLGDTKLVSVPMPITNKTGGGGGVNLAYMQTKKGSDNLISVYSPPILLIPPEAKEPTILFSSIYSFKNLATAKEAPPLPA